jgi:DNA-binding transcriptional regulator YhcF (GntR family)
LKAQGVERFEWGQTRISALSVDRAIVNKTYRRLRKDGTLVMEAASFYVVTRSSGAWKICGILNQNPREFGKTF